MTLPRLQQLAMPQCAEVLPGATGVDDLLTLLSDDTGRSAVLCADSGIRILTKARFETLMTGRLGYGRAIHARTTLAHLAVTGVVVVDDKVTLDVAATRALSRDEDRRWEELVYVAANGSVHLLPVAPMLVELSRYLGRLAVTDELTGLPNRRALEEHLAGVLLRREPTLVTFVDLDRFKVVNDSLGHGAGDTVLLQVSQRLRQHAPAGSFLARLSGDEFVVVSPAQDVPDALATAIVAAVAAPLEAAGRQFVVTASAGAALSEDGESAQRLLARADMAMYRAKSTGARVCVYDPALDVRTDELAALTRLRAGLDAGALDVHFQPVVDLRTASVSGHEALLRWTEPDGRQVPALEVVKVAEASGLINAVGQRVLHRACLQARAWGPAQGPVVSVNLSPLQLRDDEILDVVAGALCRFDLPPGRLCLELTESAAMVDLDATVRRLEALKRLGVSLALDDFGTGHSSLAVLRSLPIDVLKLDRSFVRGVDTDPADRNLMAHLVGLAHGLGLAVTAEGVERPDQARVLCETGVDHGQGWFFGRPVPGTASGEVTRGADVPVARLPHQVPTGA